MEIDTDRIDQAVLALLRLGLHDGYRAWKTFDWSAMDRLHAKGFISNPASRAKSVVLTDEGLRPSERLFRELFAARRWPCAQRDEDRPIRECTAREVPDTCLPRPLVKQP